MDSLPLQIAELFADVERYAPIDTHTAHTDATASGDGEIAGVVTFYSAVNKYRLKYRVVPDAPGYLGCIAVSRTPRAGEEWCRGNDLPDGSFSRETWTKILAAVVSYEMVRVHIEKR